MENERPTSVNVVGWFFIIIGSFSTLSAAGYIVVTYVNSKSFLGAWPSLVQIIIASTLVYAGIGLLRGSALMRQVLELSSYGLVALLIGYIIHASQQFGTWWPLAGMLIYLIPLGFVIVALRGQKIKTYVSTTKT